MDRNVRKKFDNEGQEKLVSMLEVDWTKLPNDTMIRLFSCLNNRYRASLSSTGKSWWIMSKSPFLWQSLDLRFYKCNAQAAKSLASRFNNLQKLRFRGYDTTTSIINLKAINLREIIINGCGEITDVTFSVLVALHEVLECLQIEPDFCKNISSVAIKVIALCRPNLKKLWPFGAEDINGEAIHTLADNCPKI